MLSLALWSAATSGAQPLAQKLDFGRHELGEPINLGSTPIASKRDCQTRSLYSCEVQLDDGVWYMFDNQRIVAKTIRMPFPFLPQGIIASDNPSQCRRRLERLTGAKFKIWTDDYGVIFVETSDLIFPRRGQPYGISVAFRGARMQDVVITALPHPDS